MGTLARKAIRAWRAWLRSRRIRALNRTISRERRRHGRVRPLEKQKQDIVHAQLRKELGITS